MIPFLILVQKMIGENIKQKFTRKIISSFKSELIELKYK